MTYLVTILRRTQKELSGLPQESYMHVGHRRDVYR